jgi:hyperosmotically inducible protein
MLGRLIIAGFLSLLLGTATLAQPAEAFTTWQRDAESVPDHWIKTQLITQYGRNSELTTLNIGTRVDNGVVTLTGQVSSQAEKALAGRIAANVDGVTRVDNQINVGVPPIARSAPNTLYHFTSDANTTTMVEMRLLQNKKTDQLQLQVNTNDHVVTLDGTVETQEQRQLAGRIAQGTMGVQEVINNLRVKGQQKKGQTASDSGG